MASAHRGWLTILDQIVKMVLLFSTIFERFLNSATYPPINKIIFLCQFPIFFNSEKEKEKFFQCFEFAITINVLLRKLKQCWSFDFDYQLRHCLSTCLLVPKFKRVRKVFYISYLCFQFDILVHDIFSRKEKSYQN